MKKSIFLFFAAILCAFSMNVQGANTMRIYCKQAQNWWKSDGAAVGAHYWGTAGDGTTWPGKRMTKVSGQTDLWYIDVDIDKYQKIIFTRVNGSGTVSDWGAKTGDLTIANTTNQYTISSSSAVWGDPGVKGSWGTYKPTSTAALATSAANIFVGGQATLTSSLTSNASANTIKETAYAISPAGANVSGNTFTATAEGTYTITATVTYYPLGCPTLTSTATAETTIKAEVPAEETHDVTVSYICGESVFLEVRIFARLPRFAEGRRDHDGVFSVGQAFGRSAATVSLFPHRKRGAGALPADHERLRAVCHLFHRRADGCRLPPYRGEGGALPLRRSAYPPRLPALGAGDQLGLHRRSLGAGSPFGRTCRGGREHRRFPSHSCLLYALYGSGGLL